MRAVEHHDHSPPLRVVMPLLTLVPGEMGGSETYVRELLRVLSLRGDVEVVAVVTEAMRGETGVEEFVVPYLGGGSTRDRVVTLARAAWSRQARAVLSGADVVHFPLSVPAPLSPRGVPFVQSLLDVQHLDLPGMFSRAEREYRRVAYDRTARKAACVITISEFCRGRIIGHLGLPEERVHVAPGGVDLARFRPARGVPENFVLYPAREWPHKNHPTLVSAMAEVRKSNPDMRLVLTGTSAGALTELPRWVEVLGRVSADELVSLYQRAACVAFPSTYEGFGLPPLEAMASGCPVAYADATALPEILGDSGVRFDPADPRAIARGIERVLELREHYVAVGLERARQFTWEKCAEKHVEAFRSVARTCG
jgi:glycosyltransferase involved in cell wall biosynthesis